MPKSARDRIKYPRVRSWARISADEVIRTGPVLSSVLGDLGDLIEVIEQLEPETYLNIEWSRLSVPSNVKPQTSGVDELVDLFVAKANSISAAYSGAVSRRSVRDPRERYDIAASKELLNFNTFTRGLGRDKSAEDSLRESLRSTESLQKFLDLFEEHVTKVVASYDDDFVFKQLSAPPPPLKTESLVKPTASKSEKRRSRRWLTLWGD